MCKTRIFANRIGQQVLYPLMGLEQRMWMLRPHSFSYQTPMKLSSKNIWLYIDPNDDKEEVDERDYQQFLKDSIEWAMLALTPQEIFLITRLWGLGGTAKLTYDEVGHILGYTINRVIWTEQECFKKMRIQLGGPSFYKEGCQTL